MPFLTVRYDKENLFIRTERMAGAQAESLLISIIKYAVNIVFSPTITIFIKERAHC
jgi:hypothetical protein